MAIEVRVEVGGDMNAVSGNFFLPTVLTEVNHTMSVMRVESLGPITGMQNVEGDDEASKIPRMVSQHGCIAGGKRTPSLY